MFRSQRIAVAACVGAILNLIVAWACIGWAPTTDLVDPMVRPGIVEETSNPDGEKCLHWRESGFGWTMMSPMGWRDNTNGEVNWRGPYGGVYHRTAGFPFQGLWSRVTVLDSQSANRTCEGCPEYEPVIQRVRWELPLEEIMYRGLATKDLPNRLHAQPDRRFPLVPLAPAFLGNTLFYGCLFVLCRPLPTICRRRWLQRSRGFPVLIAEVASSSPSAAYNHAK